jgi:uncharacterized protein
VSSGTLIREARQRARLSQTDLARRAGVAQSVISAYESDRREPGLGMLTKLIEAAGHELFIDARPMANLRHGLPDTPLGRRLRRNRRAVIDTLARRGARHPQVFGSVARGEDGAASDIDLLVDVDPNVGLLGLAGLTRELTDLLGVSVDVVPRGDLKPSVRDEILAEAIPL